MAVGRKDWVLAGRSVRVVQSAAVSLPGEDAPALHDVVQGGNVWALLRVGRDDGQAKLSQATLITSL